MAASKKKTKIHFALDGINMESIDKKGKGDMIELGERESITVSELPMSIKTGMG